jgi:glucosamine--fructose-6-phosphate aminotransferase (isomerizing)
MCNVAQSSLVREADLAFLTHAGVEIGVAATKTFTAQLVGLLMLSIILAQTHQVNSSHAEEAAINLRNLPNIINETLNLESEIRKISKRFSEKHHALFLGRGLHYPVALEGALKLKEISYLHAEAYPAGELKHGPLALVDEQMPVIVVAPQNKLIDKLASNIQEVQARGGELYIFSDHNIQWSLNGNSAIISMPNMHEIISPIAYSIPLQLLAYHVAVQKGTDVDQPRNLAKSVTVE